MPPVGPLTYAAPKVIGVLDADIDPDGYVPFELLSLGLDVVVPLWPFPASAPGERDILIVTFALPGQRPVEIENIYLPADMRPEFIIHIGPEHLQIDGVADLSYKQLDSADNPAYSYHRNLTIDHTPTRNDLPQVKFPHATLTHYLNCETEPPMWDGIQVDIPPLAGFQVGDRCEMVWRVYFNLNVSGNEFVPARKIITRPSISQNDIQNGFSELILPYETHIKPMERDCSARLDYRIYRGARLLGVSELGYVKVDRGQTGDGLCGP